MGLDGRWMTRRHADALPHIYVASCPSPLQPRDRFARWIEIGHAHLLILWVSRWPAPLPVLLLDSWRLQSGAFAPFHQQQTCTLPVAQQDS